jgi:Zn-dependent protease with chaperone function
MIVAVYLPLVLPMLAVPLVRWLAARLHPAVGTWFVVLSAVVLGTGAMLALGLLMFAALSVVSVFARLGHWSPAAVRHHHVVHIQVDIAACVLVVVLGGAAIAAGVRRFRAIRAAHRAAGLDPAGPELMVVEDERPLAHALPGKPGRIVVSTSMLATLGPAERRALLAHERAHLSFRHHRFVAVVDVLAAAYPILRPLVSVIRFTTERWADEIAAGQLGDRSVVARAVGTAALAGLDAVEPVPLTLAANGSATLSAGGPVPRRVAALLTGPPRGAWSLLASPIGLCAVLVLALSVSSMVFAVSAALDLHTALEQAQNLPLKP